MLLDLHKTHRWNWIEVLETELDQMTSNASRTHTSTGSIASSGRSQTSLTSNTKTPAITHTIVLKCIGAVRDEKQQKLLEEVYSSRYRAQSIPVKLEPEPENEYDSQAIHVQN